MIHSPSLFLLRRQWQPTPVFLPGESQRQWAPTYGVTLSWTRLKRLSSSSSSSLLVQTKSISQRPVCYLLTGQSRGRSGYQKNPFFSFGSEMVQVEAYHCSRHSLLMTACEQWLRPAALQFPPPPHAADQHGDRGCDGWLVWQLQEAADSKHLPPPRVLQLKGDDGGRAC